MIYDGELRPKHGPGSTADSLRGNQKWTFPTWTERLEMLFPFTEMALVNDRYWEESSRTRFLHPVEEPPVKMVDVPKTQLTPRLIAVEPTHMQYVQQAIASPLVDLIEKDPTAKWFTGFTEQWPNQVMAQVGSEDGSLATLDLSEASDRVANWVVEDLFSDFPWFLEGIEACRSTHARLPWGEVIPLNKFASMGSAMTFPIEAMVFTAIVLEACVRADGYSKSRMGLKAYRKVLEDYRDRVRVYGDDIIVPTHLAETVIESLEVFGFQVNRNKSFWSGDFRESCGKEYWKGYDVSIVRFRKAFPASPQNAEEIVSAIATRNQLVKNGLVKTAELMDGDLEKVIRPYPYVLETSPLLGRIHPKGYYTVDSWSDDHHAPVTKGWVVDPKAPKSELDGYRALLKCLLTTVGVASVDEKHLRRAGRPRAVKLKPVKARPY